MSRGSRFWIPTTIAFLALCLSGWATYIAHEAKEDVRAIHGFDLKPTLTLKAWFEQIKDVPPHFVVTNKGPVQAEQIEIDVRSHRYQASSGKVLATVAGSHAGIYKIAKLPVMSSKAFTFQPGWLDTNSRLYRPLKHNVMEIRLKYRRPSDKQQYVESAFYFVHPEGHWVSEYGVPDEEYALIKRGVLKHVGRLSQSDFDFPMDGSDPLHAPF